MKASALTLINTIARQFQLTVHVDSLHGAQGVELRKQAGNTDTVVCVGYYFRDQQNAEIYRRIDSKRDILVRTRFWFLWGWLVKKRIKDNQYRVLCTVPVSKFSEKLFVDIVKREFEDT